MPFLKRILLQSSQKPNNPKSIKQSRNTIISFLLKFAHKRSVKITTKTMKIPPIVGVLFLT
jgi:hypothetical protein